MKQLSDLPSNLEDCKRVFREVADGDLLAAYLKRDCIELCGIRGDHGYVSLFIYFDGVSKETKEILTELGYESNQ